MSIDLEKKNEYTIHLINILSPILFDGILSIYNESKNLIDDKNCNDNLKIFQTLLKSIPNWDKSILNPEVNRIKISSKCEYLEKLLKVIFKYNLKILVNYELEIEDINFSNFIHNCYISIAKSFYQNPDLLYHKVKQLELKQNYRKCLDIIKEDIRNTIRKMLPLESIIDINLNYLEKNKDNNSNFNNNFKTNNNDDKQLDVNSENDNDNSSSNPENINTSNKSDLNSNKLDNISKNISNDKSVVKSNKNISISLTKSVTSSLSNNYNEPDLINDKIKSQVINSFSNSDNTNKIINSVKNHFKTNDKILSSEDDHNNVKSINESIKTINNDTSISYNIEDNDNNYITVYNDK